MSRNQGRIPYVDPLDPQSWGRDDITGLPVMHPDLVKYYEYMGTGLQWTGFMTHYKDVDQPNPQLIPPNLPVDPIPIQNPRYLILAQTPPVPVNIAVQNITANSAEITWTNIQGISSYSVLLTTTWGYYNAEIATESPYTFTLLVPNQTYFVQVASQSAPADGGALNTPTQSAYSFPAISFNTLGG